VHDAAATHGQCLALSKVWWSCVYVALQCGQWVSWVLLLWECLAVRPAERHLTSSFARYYRYCLSKAMHSVGQNMRSRKRQSVHPASADKIVTLVMGWSSPNLEHSLHVLYRRKDAVRSEVVYADAQALINHHLQLSKSCLHKQLMQFSQNKVASVWIISIKWLH